MDFIIDLSSNGESEAVFDFILIVMNKYMKMIKSIPAKKIELQKINQCFSYKNFRKTWYVKCDNYRQRKFVYFQF